MTETNRYAQIIESIFQSHFRKGIKEFAFERGEIEKCAAELGINLPKNLGDLIYSFRYRTAFPKRILAQASTGSEWVIMPAGKGRYRFALRRSTPMAPAIDMPETKLPDATPSIIDMYALNDEQALLARLRYNRLIDIFTRTTCYSLQNHLRTFVPGMGQVETDEIYVGVDRSGTHYVVPVQAKAGRDKLSSVQIEQDIALCRNKFPSLVCRPVGAQFIAGGMIVLFEFDLQDGALLRVAEKHFRLVSPDQLSAEELDKYRSSKEE